ncbi:Condensation domain-containing protein [Chitinophaga sp. CF118]|uniref:condensation domain-containing protein n=1 Tax=Chitinophaga sp. CF118 TaxID=1884367 RepID=UPI0008EF3556|nr:condensation domain-containing protein [Chitinophaga sp. CF118]SFE76953.1 Condensation domain-containing protein [Chitinophaga sp. CF118]
MNRQLLFLERILYGDGFTPFNIVFVVKITGTISYGNLRNALTKIQAKHPLLRSGIKSNDKKIPHFFLNERVPEIPIRIVERKHDDDWIEASKAAWANVFDTRNGPLMGVTWVRSPDISELLISLHHCMCDGGALLLLVREMLALLDNPEKEIGQHTSFTTIKDIVPAAILKSRKNILKAKFSGAVLRLALSAATAFIRPGKIKINREADYLISWKFSKADSSALFKACSAAGVTVNTALCVAFLNAFREVKGDNAHNKITCPVDIRKFVENIDKDTIFSFGLVLTLSIDKDPNMQFWDRTRLLQKKVTSKMADMNPYEFLMAFENAHSSVHKMRKMLTYGKVGYDLMFSNLGKLDIPQHFNSFDIEAIYSPSVIGPFANPTTIITSTFNNQIDFTFISNDGVLDRADARAIRDNAIALLQREATLPVTEPVHHNNFNHEQKTNNR